MKVAYLLDGTSLCGGVRVVFRHARLLADRGFSVTIISKGEKPSGADAGAAAFLPIRKEFHEIIDLLSDFDLVIATFYPQVIELYDTPVRLAHFSQGYEADYPFWSERKDEIERAYRLPVPKITSSKGVETMVRERFSQPTYYIAQGIDLDAFFVREGLPGIKRVLIVGTWENEIKGIRYAVEGFSIAKEMIRDLSLVRVSTLPMSDEERAVHPAHEYHTAVAPGEMPHIYRGCDLAVVPSLEGEGFGLPAIEAMACGVPVVLTRIQSFLSFDAAKDYAYFVSPSSSAEIADAIVRLSLSPDVATALAARARQVAENYRIETTMDHLVSILEALLRKGKTKAVPPVDFVYVERPSENDAAEERLLRELSKGTFSRGAPMKSIPAHNPLDVTVGDILELTPSDFLAICIDDTMYFSNNWLYPLMDAIQGGAELASPVCTDFFSVDGVYYSPLTFNGVAAEMERKYASHHRETNDMPPLVYLVSRRALSAVPPETPLTDLPKRLRSVITPSSLAHRFGDYYSSRRDDILPFIPYGVKKVLDIGCARGFFGEMVRRERECEVYGVELNDRVADDARTRLDGVFCSDIEKTDLPFKEDLDAIVCSDVLEHLADPWSLLRRARTWLRPGGIIIASIPNAAHYSIISDLLRGRWDYIPYGLLCITHLRFFTRETIGEMFAKSGYVTVSVTGQAWPVRLKEWIDERLSEYLKLDKISEDIYIPGYYVVAQKNSRAATWGISCR